jgi:hypothetical protein
MQKVSNAQRALTARLNDLQTQFPQLMLCLHPHGWADIRRASPMLFPAIISHLADQERVVELWRAASKQDDDQNIAAGRPISALSAAIHPSSFDRSCAAMVRSKNLFYRQGHNNAPTFDELFGVVSQGQLATAIATFHFVGRGSSMVSDMRAALASLSFLDRGNRLAISHPLGTLTHAVGTAVDSGAAVDAPHIMVSVEKALALSADKFFYLNRAGKGPLVWSEFCQQQLARGAARGPVPSTMQTVYELLDNLTEFAVVQSAQAAAEHHAVAAESLSSGTALRQQPPHQPVDAYSSNAYALDDPGPEEQLHPALLAFLEENPHCNYTAQPRATCVIPNCPHPGISAHMALCKAGHLQPGFLMCNVCGLMTKRGSSQCHFARSGGCPGTYADLVEPPPGHTARLERAMRDSWSDYTTRASRALADPQTRAFEPQRSRVNELAETSHHNQRFGNGPQPNRALATQGAHGNGHTNQPRQRFDPPRQPRANEVTTNSGGPFQQLQITHNTQDSIYADIHGYDERRS